MNRSRNMPVGIRPYHRRRAAGSAPALTFMEMIISLAIMAVVFAAVLPQFRNIDNSWASRQGSIEAIQNGRVLIDHINRNLSSAVQITAVSEPDETLGFIEFEAGDEDKLTYRYDVSPTGTVRFGVAGKLSELAGPVDRLQFTCYDSKNFDTATTETTAIRCVEVAATLKNSAELGKDKTFSTKAYLRINGQRQDIAHGTSFEYDAKKGKTPALIRVAGNRFLCVYTGDHDKGMATILTVDTDSWLITQGASVPLENEKFKTPAVCSFEAGSDKHTARFLVVYETRFGPGQDYGRAAILKVDLDTWEISTETIDFFDHDKGKEPALVQIDDTHYLCAYNGKDDDGYAVVLTVDKKTFKIEPGTPYEFDTLKGKTPALVDMDRSAGKEKRYLCVYTGDGDDGWAVVLTVDTKTFEINREEPYEFDIFKGKTPAVKRLNKWKYLCAYSGGPKKDHGWAVVLNVDSKLEITRGKPFEFDDRKGETPALVAVDYLPKGVKKRSDFLCCYSGDKDRGRAVVLRVDEITWEITKGNPLDYDDIEYEGYFEFEDDKAKTPALCEIDQTHFLCAYAGGPKKDHGWAIVLDTEVPVLP